MAYISIALEWAIDQWAVVLTALAFIYNISFKRDNTQLLIASLTVTLMYSAGHFVLAWINELPVDVQVYYRYSSRLMLYIMATIFLALVTYRIGANFTTLFIFLNFVGAMVLHLLLHIDRNVIALDKIYESIQDGVIYVNTHFAGGYWGLWDWYTGLLNFSGLLVILYLLVGEEVKEYICSRYF